jgi:hypothetical protein
MSGLLDLFDLVNDASRIGPSGAALAADVSEESPPPETETLDQRATLSLAADMPARPVPSDDGEVPV